jgi:hypothetical protein
MTEQNKQPPAETGEGAVAWMWEWYGSRYDDAPGWNTNIEASKPADWELNNSEFPIRNLRPLYTSQNNATQAAVAAKLECAEQWIKAAQHEYGKKLDSEEMIHFNAGISAMYDAILASIPADHMQAVMELIAEGVRSGLQAAVNAQFMCGTLPRVAEFDTTRDVDRILAEKGLK